MRQGNLSGILVASARYFMVQSPPGRLWNSELCHLYSSHVTLPATPCLELTHLRYYLAIGNLQFARAPFKFNPARRRGGQDQAIH